MSLNKFAVNTSVNAGQVGGTGTGNDQQIKSQIAAVANAEKLRRWYVFDEMHHVQVINHNNDADADNSLTYPRRIEGFATESPGIWLVGASLFVEDVYFAAGSTTGHTMKVQMRKSTSADPTAGIEDVDWSYVIRPTLYSADTANQSESFIDLPIHMPFIEENANWVMEFHLVDQNGDEKIGLEQGWGITVINLHWSAQLNS